MTSDTTKDLILKLLDFDEGFYIPNYKIETNNNGKITLVVEYVRKHDN